MIRSSTYSVRNRKISKERTRKERSTRYVKMVMLVEKMLGLIPKLGDATSDAQKATLQNAVTATEQQIDQLVYELYGLTQEEIALVESQEPK